MQKSELLKALQNAISDAEYQALAARRVSHISAFNRRIMLEIRKRTDAPSDDVDAEQVQKLENILTAYLHIHFSEHPESWKWIILACIYLSFIQNLPLHPQEMVHYTTDIQDGKPLFFCPMKSLEADTACSFCICQKTSKNF